MNYNEAVEELFAIPRFKKKVNLDNIRELLKRVGSPQEKLKLIHVAGTNGKGSICAYLQQMFLDENHSVGMFTSPHLVCVRERIRINGKMISEEEFTICYQRVKEQSEQLYSETKIGVSFFETMVAMTLVAFERANVEYAIMEAGLGGKTDTTNVIVPIISIIASIGLDHTAILGDTIEKIAIEKAGIMKNGVPVVISHVSENVKEILYQEAEKVKAPLYDADDYPAKIQSISEKGIDYYLEYCENERIEGHINSMGIYQLLNLSVAVLAYHVMFPVVPVEKLMQAASRVVWPGRMEKIMPGIIVDGAHNPQAITQFCNSLEYFYKDKNISLLFAASNDKDEKHMIKQLCKYPFQRIYVTELENNRKTDSHIAADLFCKYGIKKECIVINSRIEEAFAKAVEEKKNDEILFCVGSLYLVGSIKEISGGKKE